MFSTENRVVKFERKPAASGSNNYGFLATIIGLTAVVFTTVMFWPIWPPATTTSLNALHSYVPPTLTTVNATQQGAGATFKCTVTRVYDGDGPIHCIEGASIRLHAIAAREMDGACLPGHPCPVASAAAAKRELQSLVLHHVLRCEQTGTSYNRVTAICWTESGLEVNCAMVRSGKALLWDKYDRQRRICG